MCVDEAIEWMLRSKRCLCGGEMVNEDGGRVRCQRCGLSMVG